MSMNKKMIVLVSGGSCSGKTVFATLFKDAYVLEMDHFYFGKSEMTPQPDGTYDWDAPEAVDLVACAQAIRDLADGKEVTVPVYDMKLSERTGTQTIKPKDTDKFIVVPGIFAFNEPIRALGDMKIYIDAPREIRVARRMIRDTAKGRSDIDTLSFSINVEKNHQKYVEPMKQYADLVIPFSYNPVQFLAEE